MAKLCSQCGQPLPRDDARFCTKCGSPVVSTALPQAAVAAQTYAPPPVQSSRKTVLREQIAQQPPARPSRRIIQTERSSSREKLQRQEASGDVLTGRAEVSGQGAAILQEHPGLSRSITWPEPLTHVSVNELAAEKQDQASSDQEEFPTLAAEPQGRARALHVKVWDQDDLEAAVAAQPVETEQSVDQLSTQPTLEVIPPQPTYAEQPAPPPVTPAPYEPVNEQEQSQNADPGTDSQGNTATATEQRPEFLIVRESTPVPTALQGRFQQPPPSTPAAFHAGQKYRSRSGRQRPSLILVGVLLALLVLGVIGWIVLDQPFAVPETTNPLVRATENTLGFSLLYPNDWKSDKSASSIHFYDSTHTDQVNVDRVNAAGEDPAQVLQQRAAQLGMKNVHTLAPISFGGASWQQVQGDLLQSGASYTGTLFATIHGQRLYIITQLAPRVTYKDEEQAVFAPMRASWQFL